MAKSIVIFLVLLGVAMAQGTVVGPKTVVGPGTVIYPGAVSLQTWAYVQSCSGLDASVTTITCVFGSNVATGDTVYCTMIANAATTTVSSAVLSNTGTATTLTQYGADHEASTVGYSVGTTSANSGSTATVTVTFNNSPEADIECGEYSGITTHDTNNNGNGSTGTALDSGGFNTANNNELCVGGGGIVAGATFTAGGSFTIRVQRTGTVVTSGLLEDVNIPTSGSNCEALATASSSGNWEMLVDGFH